MAFSPENLKIWVNSREIHAFIPTAIYPRFTKGTQQRRLLDQPVSLRTSPAGTLSTKDLPLIAPSSCGTPIVVTVVDPASLEGHPNH